MPGFGATLHENSAPGDVYDVLRNGGFDWASLSTHDTNHPGTLANVCNTPMSEKYQWWIQQMSPLGFPDATSPTGQAVNPPANEALALSKVATSKTVEGPGGFLAFTGREFTNDNFAPLGVGSREGGHKVVGIPGETQGMCIADGVLVGDEYCTDEYHMYLWALTQPPPGPVLIQAHPGPAQLYGPAPLPLRRTPPGGFTDQFVAGMEVSLKVRTRSGRARTSSRSVWATGCFPPMAPTTTTRLTRERPLA